MRWLLLLMSFTSILTAAEQRIYLGCQKSGTEPGGIFQTSLNPETGELQLAKRVATSENPSFLTISQKGDFLYSVSEGNQGLVVSWSIGKDGSLTKLNEQPTGGAGPCHISLTPSGQVLLVANYSGGSVASFPIQEDGTIGERKSFHQFTGSGPNPNRQKQSHAHGIYSDPVGKWVYVPDLGTDKVWIFQLNETTGVLTPNEPAYAALPPGSGPRHLTFSADAKTIYVNGELDVSITSFEVDPNNGGLKQVAYLPVLPEGLNLTKAPDTAEIAFRPNGKTLYVSTRGYNSLCSFTVSNQRQLSPLARTLISVDGPRHFSFSPDGKWLVVPGQKSQDLTVFALDPAGHLQQTKHTIQVPSPACAVFAP